MRDPDELEPLAAEVREHLRRLGAEGRTVELGEAWASAVGPEIAANAWPARVQADGTLVVHVRDAIWGFELTQRAAEIAARLPGGPRLRFVPGPLPDAAARLAAPRQGVRPSPEQEREAAGLTAGIADGELRELVARAAAASLARAGSAARDDHSV